MYNYNYFDFQDIGKQGKSEVLKYMQIVNHIILLIREGKLSARSPLPSINEMIKLTGYSRDTVLTSYRKLEELGFVQALHGKGFFVSVLGRFPQIPVFLLFDVMNGYKEVLYRSFVEALGEDYRVDIYFHYYNKEIFKKLINEKNGHYSYYVIMPHFNKDVSAMIHCLPSDRIILMDNDIPALKKKVAAVYQNFEKDIYESLKKGIELLKKYQKIYLITNTRFQFIPDGMVRGFCNFCINNNIEYDLIPDALSVPFERKNAYIAVADKDLITIIKKAKELGFELGKDIGLISYDETPLKEVLAGGITVISTDFSKMGKIAADFIKDYRAVKIENKCLLIRRNSL
ncbi:MAG: GntR family transcriptional regulator [Bacteroidales bacterium]